MSANVDFGAVMADLTKFQQEIGKIHARLTDPTQKAILGEALEKIQTARADAELHYPKAMTTIRESALQSKAQAESQLAQAEALNAQIQAMADRPRPAAPKKPEAAKFDGQLGKRLSEEMFAHFSNKPAATDELPLDDREIWQDWNWQQS